MPVPGVKHMQVTTEPTGLAATVRRHDPDRFLAALFAPPERREAFFTLCAFNHELARAREVASQPMLALIRLQWWREVVQGARRRHEVAGPLGQALDSGALPASELMEMIDAREAEADDEIADLAGWHSYVDGVGGGFAVAAGRLLGADAGQLLRLRALGAATAASGQIANVPALASRQRCLLPRDRLAAHGLTAEEVMQNPTCAAPVLVELTECGMQLLRAGEGRFPRPVIAAGLTAVLARRDLRRGDRRRGISAQVAVLLAAVLGRI